MTPGAYQVQSHVTLSQRLPALEHAAFRRWFLGSFLSNIGGSLQSATIFWLLDNITHRAQAVGIVGVIRVVPLLFLGLFAGVVADQRERAKVLLVTQSAKAVVALLLAILVFTHLITPLAVYALVGLDACAQAYDGPSRQSIVANLVPSHHYPNAASINGIQWRMSEVLGPVLSGALIAHLGERMGPSSAFFINAISFGALLYAVARLPHLPARNARSTGSREVFQSIREGVHFLRSVTVVRNAMWIDFWGTFVAGASALLPLFARAVLKVGPAEYGFLVASQGLGAMAASAALAIRPAALKPGKWVIGMIGLFGVATAGVGLSPNMAVAVVCLMAVGATDMVSTVMRQTIRQLAVPDAMRGRLSSIGMIFQVSGPQLGDFEAAQVAEAAGSRFSFVLGGLGAMFVAGWYQFRGPALRDYQYQPGTADFSPPVDDKSTTKPAASE